MISELRNSKSEVRNSPDLVLSVHNLGKMYHLYDRPQDRLKQAFLWGRKQLYREFWALRDVSFELRRGEMLGIIRRNGSGKSTLLQIIAGVVRPTTGGVQVQGRVAALLELGSGFNPEFSGRENVFLNGAILGVPREEVERRFDEIAAFADIGEFLERPVKTYSSGMFLRLAFAVTTSLDPDILLIDEALAVGDVFFRQKCYKRLETLRERGAAIIFVSHAMMDVEQFCGRAVLLHYGSPVFAGGASEAVKRYYLLEQEERAGAPVVTDAARCRAGEQRGDWG
jgi:lipopolysaccharide transport system ATP-binding protein